MNSTKSTSYILILGMIILGVFTYVAAINIFDDDASSNPFFSKTAKEVNAYIDNTQVVDNKLLITTRGDAQELCIKTTKTEPSVNALCWIKVDGNMVKTSIYSYKTYYIWLKDSNNNISEVVKYNS